MRMKKNTNPVEIRKKSDPNGSGPRAGADINKRGIKRIHKIGPENLRILHKGNF